MYDEVQVHERSTNLCHSTQFFWCLTIYYCCIFPTIFEFIVVWCFKNFTNRTPQFCRKTVTLILSWLKFFRWGAVLPLYWLFGFQNYMNIQVLSPETLHLNYVSPSTQNWFKKFQSTAILWFLWTSVSICGTRLPQIL